MDNLREGVEYTFGLYSALRACSAMVFRSRRQSRLTVATMFLEGGVTVQPLWSIEKTAQNRVYSLQGRHDATASRSRPRGRSRSSGRHPVAVGGISSSLLVVHDAVRTLDLFHRGGRSQITSPTGEGERRRRSESAGLLRVGRMGSERIHFETRVLDVGNHEVDEGGVWGREKDEKLRREVKVSEVNDGSRSRPSPRVEGGVMWQKREDGSMCLPGEGDGQLNVSPYIATSAGAEMRWQ